MRRDAVGPSASWADPGFTLTELMIVVVVIGILVAIALPVYHTTQMNARKKTCYGNQRAIESAAQTFLAAKEDAEAADLVGRLDGDSPLIGEYLGEVPPRCPSAPEPTNRRYPTDAQGAYTLDASGTVRPCNFESHLHYGDS